MKMRSRGEKGGEWRWKVHKAVIRFVVLFGERYGRVGGDRGAGGEF